MGRPAIGITLALKTKQSRSCHLTGSIERKGITGDDDDDDDDDDGG